MTLLADHWLLIACAALAVLAIAFGIGEDAPVARRVFRLFLFNIALPLAVLVGALVWVVSLQVELDNQVWAAIIAGLVIACGWLTTAIFAELGRSRVKAEKLRDYHKALYAEIGNTLASYWGDDKADAYAAEIVAVMQADPSFVPFIPREAHDRVFAALLGEIEVLPRQTIDAVIAYYALITSIAALAEDMRGDTFRGLEQPRRIAMYQDYVAMRQRARTLGQYALKLIASYASGGAGTAEAVTRAFNTPGAGRNRPSPGSE